jgi:branched-chain amino acid transport system substrate-binding protein
VSLSGDLRETPFPDLVQFYCERRDPVAVRIYSDSGVEGVFWIESGHIVDATLGEERGVDAVHAALRLREGRFLVEENVSCPARVIAEPWTDVLLGRGLQQYEPAHDTPAEVTPLTVPKIPTPPPTRMQTSDVLSDWRSARLPDRRSKYLLPVIVGIVALIVGSAIGVLLLGDRSAARERAPSAAKQTPAPEPVRVAAASTVAPTMPPARIAATDELVFGMSAALTGPAKELGRAMKTGIEVAFAAANDAGGVNGKKVRLVAMDDGYEPTRAVEAMKQLNEKHHVFGFIGNVGTPTAAVAAPYAIDHKMLFFGPFTGAKILRRDPPDRYVFNYRASYIEETAAIVRWLVDVKHIAPADIAVFAQEDAFGDAGFEGVAKAMRRYRRNTSRIVRVGYKRNTVDVKAAVTEISRWPNLRAVVMVAAYKPAAKFIEKLRDKNSDLIFTNVSFVGSTALAEELVQLGPNYARGAIVTQVVPLPQSSATAVLRYQDLLRKYAPDEKPDFVSLEGFLSGQLLVEGLRRAGPGADTEKVIDTLESLRGVDLGIGAPISFSMSEHQGSHKVWGTVLDEKGNYTNFDLD